MSDVNEMDLSAMDNDELIALYDERLDAFTLTCTPQQTAEYHQLVELTRELTIRECE